MYVEKLKEMFTRMVLQKDASLIPLYYHENFMLYANTQVMTYNDYLKFHQEVYKTPIKYEIAYDEDAFLEQGEKVAGRVWITISLPNKSSQTIEVILIALFKDNKLYRIWELTSPDWSNMSEFA